MKRRNISLILIAFLFIATLFNNPVLANTQAPSPNAWKHMNKPEVQDPDLQNLINHLFRSMPDEDHIGSGSTADAVRYEIVTGWTVKGKKHSVKAKNSITALAHWLYNHRGEEDYDKNKEIVLAIQSDLQDALNTIPSNKTQVLKELFPGADDSNQAAEIWHQNHDAA